MSVFAERVFETTSTTGTGALTLAGAQADFEAFAERFANNDKVFYVIDQAGSDAW